MKSKFFVFLSCIFAMVLCVAMPVRANAAGNPYFSGSGLKSSYEVGDTLRFSGTVYGDGDSIEKIYVHYYDPNNTNDCGEIATKYPGSLSYAMSSLGSFEVGDDLMYNETSYVVKVWAKTVGGSGGVLVYSTEVEISSGMEEPGDFEITNLSDGETVSADSSLKVKWSSSSNVEYYKIALDNKTAGTTVISSTDVDTDRNYTISASKLEPGCRYRFYVTAYNDAGRNGVYVDFYTEEEEKEVPEPYLSGSMISSSYTIGDSFSLSGKVYGDGGTIEKIYVHYYGESNSNDCGELGTVYPDSSTYSLSNLGTFKVGSGVMRNPVTYIVKAWAKNEGGDSVLLAEQRVTIKEASVPVTQAPTPVTQAPTPATAPTPKLSGMVISKTVTMGDTFSFAGTVSANGGTLQKVHINTYLKSNTVYNYVVYSMDNMNVSSFDLGNVGSFVVGRDIFEKAGTYSFNIAARNVGNSSGTTLLTMDIIVNEAPAAAATQPSLSGKLLNNSYTIGDSFSLSGEVYGDGGTIEKVYVHYYDENNTSDCGELGTAYPNSSAYSLSNMGTFTVGKNVMRNPVTYVVKVWAKNKGGDSVLLAQKYVTVSAANTPTSAPANPSTGTTPKLSGMAISKTVSMGDTFSIAGTVSANGGTLQKVHINTYLKSNSNYNYVVYSKDNMNVSSFDLKNAGSFVVGKDIFEKAGTYSFNIAAKNVGNSSGTTLLTMDIIVKEAEVVAVPQPSLSGKLLNTEYTIGESFSLSGEVSGNGGTIEKIYVHYYDENNTSDCGELGTVYPNSSVYNLSNLGSFSVGKSVMRNPVTYVVKVWAKNKGGDSVLLAQKYVTIKEGATPTPVPVPKLSGATISKTVSMGDTFSIAGTVSGNGGTLQKVHINTYLKSNTNYNYVVYSKDNMNVKSFNLSNVGSFVVGKDIFEKAGTYSFNIAARNVGNTNGTTLLTMEITVKEAAKPTVGSFSINAPADGATVSADASLVLSWTSASNAKYYKYAVSDVTSKPYVYAVESTKTTSKSVTIPKGTLTAGHTYKVYVTAYYDEETYVGKNVSVTAKAAPTVTPKPVTAKPEPTKAPIPVLSGGSAKKTVTMGDTFTLSGTVKSNGGTLDKVHINAYMVNNTSENYVLYSKEGLNKSSFSLSNAGTYTVGKDIFKKAGTYRLYVYGRNVGNTEGTELLCMEVSVQEKKVTQAVITDAPTKAPVTQKPVTQKPVTQAPVTTAPEETLGDFTFIAPADGVIVAAEADLVVYWTRSSGAEYYKYSMEDLTQGKQIINYTKVSGRGVTISGDLLENGHDYRICVAAYGEDGTRKEKEVTVFARTTLTESTNKTEQTVQNVASSVTKEGKITISKSVNNGIITLKFQSDLSKEELKKVEKTAINYYNKNDGNSCTISRIWNGVVNEFCPDIDAGTYGVEIVYYGAGNARLARGELRLDYDFGIKNYEIADMLQGDFNVLYGEVSARNGIASVTVQVTNASGKELMTENVNLNYVKSYNLSSKELDNLLEFNKLPIGKMKLRITVMDAVGQSLVKELAFSVREAAAPKVTGMKETMSVLQGSNLRLAGTLSSEKRIEKVTVSLIGIKGRNVTKNVGKNSYSLSAITLPLETMASGVYDARISVVLRGSSESVTVKEFKVYITSGTMFETLATPNLGNVDGVMSTRVQQAINDLDALDMKNFNQMYNQFRYVQHYVDRNMSGAYGTTLSVLNETAYYLYNGGADMFFGSASKEGIIKAFLKEEYLMTKDEMQEALQEGIENGEDYIDVVMLFDQMTDAQAKKLYEDLKKFVKASPTDDWTVLQGRVYVNDELPKILSPYLKNLEDMEKSNNGYVWSDNIIELLNGMEDGTIKDSKQLKNASILSSSSLKKFQKYGEGTLAFIDVALLTNEVCSTLNAYANVSASQIAKLKEIRTLATDKETINALNELIAELESEGIKGIQDALKTLATEEMDILTGIALEKLLGPYGMLYDGAQLVCNALCSGGSQSKASHYIVALMDSNLSAANSMLDKCGEFLENPSEQTLQTFCTALGYFLDSTENCVGLGTMYETDRILWFSDSEREKEYEAKELKRLEPFRAFYNKYRTK